MKVRRKCKDREYVRRSIRKMADSLEAEDGRQEGDIMLPGTLQGAGYGNPVTRQTPWVSSLHGGTGS